MPTVKDIHAHVFAYILDAIETENMGIDNPTHKQLVNYVYETFQGEFMHPNVLRQYGNESGAFAAWLQGLPSVINIDFYYHDIDKLGHKWGILGTNSRIKAVEDFRSNWWNRIAMAFFVMKNRLANQDNLPENALLVSAEITPLAYTTLGKLRTGFWLAHEDIREHFKPTHRHDDYSHAIQNEFAEFVKDLRESKRITEKLASRASL